MEERLQIIVKKYPGIFSSQKNRRTIFESRGKDYIIEETIGKNNYKKSYHVIEVLDNLSLKLGKTFDSLEKVEATYVVELSF